MSYLTLKGDDVFVAQTIGRTDKGNTERTIKSRVPEHMCLSSMISFCSQKVWDPSHCEVITSCFWKHLF